MKGRVVALGLRRGRGQPIRRRSRPHQDQLWTKPRYDGGRPTDVVRVVVAEYQHGQGAHAERLQARQCRRSLRSCVDQNRRPSARVDSCHR